jgi:hypothetical protein
MKLPASHTYAANIDFQVDKKLKASLKKSIEDEYVSLDSMDPTSAAWTMTMIEVFTVISVSTRKIEFNF